jgi:hypothetical protein
LKRKWRLRDLPDGQISAAPTICLSSPFCKNILIFRIGKSVYIVSIPSHKRDVSRSSRTLVRDAMDDVQRARRADWRVRRSRVVLAPKAGVKSAGTFPCNDDGG